MNRTLRIFVFKWMPAIAWMILIFAGSSDALSSAHTSRFFVPFLLWLNPKMSPQMIEILHLMFRKAGHVTEYAILAALLWRALRGTFTALSMGTIALCTFVIAIAFAASDEFHQTFVPSRTATFHDVLIDCAGVMITIAICVLFSRARMRSAAQPV